MDAINAAFEAGKRASLKELCRFIGAKYEGG
jgi:hypothetical protein